MKKILTCILSLILVLSVSGCAKKAANITGTWYGNIFGKVLTMKINEGGIYNMEMMDEAMIGTWVQEDDTLYVDKGTAGEQAFHYDADAQTLDLNGSLFTRKSIEEFKPAKTIQADVEDFTGSWIATNVDASGSAFPLDTAKFYMDAKIEDTMVILTTGADKMIQQGEAVFADSELTLTISAANESGKENVYRITMLKNGMISISAELDGNPATFYLEKTAA